MEFGHFKAYFAYKNGTKITNLLYLLTHPTDYFDLSYPPLAGCSMDKPLTVLEYENVDMSNRGQAC